MATLPVPRGINGSAGESGAPPNAAPSSDVSDVDDHDRQGPQKSALVAEARAHRLTETRRNAVRHEALGQTPWWYNPYAHLAATTGIGVTVLATSIVAITRLSTGVRATDLLIIPAVVLFANYFEWRVHRDLLHKRFWPFETIYDKHTPMHHMIYVEEDMTLRGVQEFRLVLIPAAGVLGIVLATAPLALGIAYFWSSAAGWLFLLTASLFMVTYELLHLAYHAPKDSFVGKRKIIARLRAHHARHHDPRLMQRYNFNVTVPLFDWLMGTVAPKRDTRDR